MTPAAEAALEALDPRGDRPLARYALVLRPGQDPTVMTRTLLRELRRFEPGVAPLSPTDHGVLVLALGTKTLHGTQPATAFAAGYALADDFDVRVAEPDLPTPFF